MGRSKTRLAVWGAACALGFATIAGIAGYGLFQQETYVHEAQDKAADYAEHAARQAQQACIRLPAPEQAQCLSNQQAEYELKARDNRREHDDLVAQRKSALWTFVMGMAALIGMALSAIGVALVKQTFDETRRTNRIAMKENARATRRAVASAKDAEAALAIAARSADAAAAQVTVVQDTAKRELRAYVGVKDITLSEVVRTSVHPNIALSKGPGSVHVALKNYGKTPAAITFHAKAQFGGDRPRPRSLAKPGGAPLILQPGRSIYRSFPIREVKGGDPRYFVILRIFYTDIYGVGYGHRIDYETEKPTYRKLNCTYEKETVHPPPPTEGETAE